jgi:hypothetical protein
MVGFSTFKGGVKGGERGKGDKRERKEYRG